MSKLTLTNFLRNKSDILTTQITGNVDVMVVSETKLDDSFPESQFKIPGYSPLFRLDRDQSGGGVMVFAVRTLRPKFYLTRINPLKLFLSN